MKYTDPRRTAFDILSKVQSRHLALDRVIEMNRSRIAEMDPKDRRLMNAIVYGVLRWRSRLDRVLAKCVKSQYHKVEPEIRDILRIALFQIIYLDRVPDSAAVNTAVDLAKRLPNQPSGFVNGVLRNAQKSWKKHYDPPRNLKLEDRMAWRNALPEWMVSRWKERFGVERLEGICESTNKIPDMTLKVNGLRANIEEVRVALLDRVGTLKENPWLDDALDFSHPDGAIDRLPGFKDGHFLIQDASAQLVCKMLGARPGERILDACAGYGGKTGHVAQMMDNQGELIAADVVTPKLHLLHNEMLRMGIQMVKTQPADLTKPAESEPLGKFDRILVDAPCTGLGVVRRNPDIKWNRNPAYFEKFSIRQKNLLNVLSGNLRPGGLMVYAVCSTEPEETVEVITDFLEKHREFKVEMPGAHFPDSAREMVTEDGYFMPWMKSFELDGFFAVALRKSGRRKRIS